MYRSTSLTAFDVYLRVKPEIMKTHYILFSLFSTMILYGQETVIPVWSSGIPGAIDNPEYHQQEMSKGNDQSSRISKVTDPVIEVFLPPEDLANGTAVLVCPGGGYAMLAIGHEGRDVAEWFNNMGVAAFVLQYRLPSDAIMKDKSIGPLQDAQEAMRILRRNSGKWHIDPGKIGVMGFSAGGHLASTASTHYMDRVYADDGTTARPDFSILIYPVISMDTEITHIGSRNNLIGEHPSAELAKRFSNELQITGETPPAFLVHSSDDTAVPVENSIRYYLGLKNHKVPAEMHVYTNGGHGYGMGRSQNTESSWPGALKRWMKMNGWL